MCVCVYEWWGGERLLSSDIFFLWLVCMCMHMGRFASSHVVCAFVSVITLIDTEKAQMHAIVIIGHQLIF